MDEGKEIYMLEELKRLLESGEQAEARRLADQLYREGEDSDTFWILNSALYEEEGDRELEFACIQLGLRKNPNNYELYFMLGNYYQEENINQAYLCYEQALHCCSGEEDRAVIQEQKERMKDYPEFSVQPLSVVITFRGNTEPLEACINSIQDTNQESCEIIVSGYSQDEEGLSRLEEDAEIRVLRETLDRGQIMARNRGIKACEPEHDVLLLYADTVLPPRALFWLRMGLYERETVGAVGPLTNIRGIRGQGVPGIAQTVKEALAFGEQITLPEKYPYENKSSLSCFALLIKRRALDDAGLFDLRYGWGGMEDIDYGMKLTLAGYEMLLCHNSFVYWGGSDSLFQDPEQCKLLECENVNRMYQKWGFHMTYYSAARDMLIDCFDKEKNSHFRVLEVGCGCGSTLANIRYRFPNSEVYGIELVEKVAEFGKFLGNIITGDIETMRLPYEGNFFDYILFGDVLEHLRDPAAVLCELKKYLKPDGKIIASIPNVMNISVVAPLLRGYFTYQEGGLLDKTHIHLFTLKEIFYMFVECGYEIQTFKWTVAREDMLPEEEELAELVYSLPDIGERNQFEAYQYIVTAGIKKPSAGKKSV